MARRRQSEGAWSPGTGGASAMVTLLFGARRPALSLQSQDSRVGGGLGAVRPISVGLKAYFFGLVWAREMSC